MAFLRLAVFIAIAFLFDSCSAKQIVVGQRNVGGFNYPWNPAVNYTAWQQRVVLRPGDTLVFEYPNSGRLVNELPSLDALLACDFSSAQRVCGATMGANVLSKPPGCAVPVSDRLRFFSSSQKDCAAGQRVAVMPLSSAPVLNSRVQQPIPESPLWQSGNKQQKTSALLASSAAKVGAAPVNTEAAVNTTAAVNAARKIVVGYNAPTYSFPFNPRVPYATWVAQTKIYVGDILQFQYPAYADTLVQFSSYDAYAACNYAYATVVCYDNWGTFCRVQATATPAYYGSGMYGHCLEGQKLTVKGAQRPYQPRTLVVGYPSQAYPWNWNPQANLQAWAANNPVYIGDTLVFKYPKHQDEVYIVPTIADYQNCVYRNYISYCNETDGAGAGCFSNPITTTTYFISGLYQSCMKQNERVIIVPRQPPA